MKIKFGVAMSILMACMSSASAERPRAIEATARIGKTVADFSLEADTIRVRERRDDAESNLMVVHFSASHVHSSHFAPGLQRTASFDLAGITESDFAETASRESSIVDPFDRFSRTPVLIEAMRKGGCDALLEAAVIAAWTVVALCSNSTPAACVNAIAQYEAAQDAFRQCLATEMPPLE